KPASWTLVRRASPSWGARASESAVVVCMTPDSPPPRTTEIFIAASAAAPGALQDSDALPGPGDRLALVARGAEEVAGDGDGGVGGDPEVARRFEVLGQRDVPDAPRRLPGVAADGRGSEVEGPVGDARVDVDAAIVVLGVVVVGEVGVAAHRARLAVEVVGRAGRLHRPQGLAAQRRTEDAGADQPVGLVGRLAEVVL